ncbi:unnamed protein product, partial [marine sediment metagenome]
FDPAVDPAPSHLFARVDPLLIASQTEISRNAPRPAESATAGRSSDDAAIRAVKSIVAEMLPALAAGQFDRLPDYVVVEDAPLIRGFLASHKELERKTQILKDLIEQMGAELPSDVMTAGELYAMTVRQVNATPGLLAIDVDRAAEVEKILRSLTYTVSDGKVLVSGPDDAPATTFVRSGGQWKIDLGPEFRAAFPAVAGLMEGYERYLDSLTSQINAGTITAYDLAVKSQAIFDSTVAPAMEAFRIATYEASRAAEAEPT